METGAMHISSRLARIGRRMRDRWAYQIHKYTSWLYQQPSSWLLKNVKMWTLQRKQAKHEGLFGYQACYAEPVSPPESCGWEAGTCVQGNLTEPTDDNSAHMVSTSSSWKSMRLMGSWYNAVSSWNLVEMKAVIHQIRANACESALLTSSQVISHCSWYTNDSSWPAEQPRSEGPSYLLVLEIFWGFW